MRRSVPMRLGVLALAVGLPLLGLGIYGIDRGGTIRATSYPAGLVLLSLGVVMLAWSGWHGSDASWLIAAPAAAILTGVMYELVRQGPPLPQVAFLGELTGVVLSGAAGIGTVVIGWLRARRRGGATAR